jgi:hypothetical protein
MPLKASLSKATCWMRDQGISPGGWSDEINGYGQELGKDKR